MTTVTCPGCGAAAEITERFTLASTDGPVAHVRAVRAGGHHYRMAADRLPARPLRPRTHPRSAQAAAHLPALHPLPGQPGRILGQPQEHQRGAPVGGACPAATTWTASSCDMIPFGR